MAVANPRDSVDTPALGYYLALGYTVYFMMHCPNNLHCPALAQNFHTALRQRLNGEIHDLPPWPMPQQESLF